MFKFRRNTKAHDENALKMLESLHRIMSPAKNCCIHMLESDRWMTLDEIIQAHRDYNEKFEDEQGRKPLKGIAGEVMPEEILMGLATLVQFSVVTMRNVTEEQSDS